MSKGKFTYHAKAPRIKKPKLTIPREPEEVVHLEFCAPGANEVSLAGSLSSLPSVEIPYRSAARGQNPSRNVW